MDRLQQGSIGAPCAQTGKIPFQRLHCAKHSAFQIGIIILGHGQFSSFRTIVAVPSPLRTSARLPVSRMLNTTMGISFSRHRATALASMTFKLSVRTRSKLRLSRSEEHTSELQSLMRIPYAGFCFNKTKTTETQYQ